MCVCRARGLVEGSKGYEKNWNVLALVLLVIAACSASTWAQAQPKFLIIKGLKEDAAYALDSKTFEELLNQPGGMGSRDVNSMKATKERADRALQRIQQLTASGTPETEPIEINGTQMTLGELAEQLFKVQREAAKGIVYDELGQGAAGTKSFVDDIASGKLNDSDAFGDSLSVAKFHSDRLLKAVIEAQKLGFSDDFKLNLYGQDYMLPELKEMAIYVSTNSQKQKDAIVAARNAKDEPFLKALTGDKARIFKEEFGDLGGQWLCIGSGGGALTTPAQMKAASVWYTYGNSRGIVDTWHITGYRFSGDKLVGRVSKSGFGLKPSAGNFN